jgi:hypothetical protein
MVQFGASGTMQSMKLTDKNRAAMARRRSKSRVSAAGPKKRRFVLCVRNDDNPAALKLRKTYEVIPDGKAERNHLIRVVDELGEDYLYPEKYFVAVKSSER